MASTNPPSAGPNKLILGVLGALLLLTGLFLVRFWMQVNDLDRRLEQAGQRETELEQRVLDESLEAAQARESNRRARALAADAKARAAAEAEARSQAEFERELARETAERAMSESERARALAEESRREYERIRDARLIELERMRGALSRIAETERTPLGLVVRLGEDALQFDFDKAEIREQNKELLSRIAGVLLASHGYHLSIYGYTDDQGPAEYNQQLSERRAQAVRKYMISAGIPAEIMEARGFGETSPRAKGASATAHQQNRRVEIGIVDTVIEYKAQTEER